MSTRERWIVYPLLFLSIGMSFRIQLVGMETLRCNRLFVGDAVVERLHVQNARAALVTITDPDGRRRIALGSAQSDDDELDQIDSVGGLLEIYGRNAQPVVRLYAADDGKSGGVLLMQSDGLPLVSLGAGPRGGRVATHDTERRLIQMLSHEDELAGHFAVLPRPEAKLQFLSRPIERADFPPRTRKPSPKEQQKQPADQQHAPDDPETDEPSPD